MEASAEARRAQTLLMDAMRELERVRAFAEQSEEQRGEVIAAAKSAAEVLARHEAASGDQAAALEALDQRARAAEAETQRVGRMLMEAAEEREQIMQELRLESEAKARAVAAAAAAARRREARRARPPPPSARPQRGGAAAAWWRWACERALEELCQEPRRPSREAARAARSRASCRRR